MHANTLARPSFGRIAALILRALLFTGLFLPLASPAKPAHAATRPVTFTISELDQLGSFDVSTYGDFYAKVWINGVEHDTSSVDYTNPFDGYIVPSGNLLPGPWVIEQDVPADALSVPIRVEIWDSDFPDGDDQADISPASGPDLNLEVNMATATWTGDVNFPEGCSSGPTDPDSNGVRICFDVSTLSTSGDYDGDGIPDTWEQRGVDFNHDGVIDLNLPAMGASPLRKDVFVEVDCLVAADHTHCPKKDSIADVVNAFARAPVVNMDGSLGVQLHVDTGPLYGAGQVFTVVGRLGSAGNYGDLGGGGDQIPEAGNEIINSFSTPHSSGTPFDNLKNTYFNAEREPIFHYAIFGHQTNARQASGDCTSGETSGIGGHDFMVTLGGGPFPSVPSIPCWGTDANGFSVGSRPEQAGTFMHELGHSLGLQHGGDLSLPNNKPNYLSVMNYSFQMCSIPTAPNGILFGGCDYSEVELPSTGVPLNEDTLDECIGIDDGLFAFGPVDWNHNTLLEGVTDCQPPNNANVGADINGDGIHTLLKGFDDWSHLNYTSSIGGTGATGGVPDEANPQMIQDAQTATGDLMAPDVVVTKSGPATALPGDTLNYTTTVKNQGFGPALDAVLTDSNPDGTSQQYNLGALAVGDSQTKTSSFTVPSDACPGDLTSADAKVDYKDIVGHDLTASGSAPLKIADVVAPTISVSVSPSVLWPPDHKFVNIAATITASDNCDPNPAITLVSITSNEPATGFLGQGDQGPDVLGATLGTDDRSFALRSERATGGSSTGRVYTITYRATDASGNTTDATATVTVPIDATTLH